MIYGVFGGEYSDWYTVGYFTDENLADKYCAAHTDCYVIPLDDLTDTCNLSDIKIGYEYIVYYDTEAKERQWFANNYTPYILNYENYERKNKVEKLFSRYKFNIYRFQKTDDETLFKIAQDYLSKIKAYIAEGMKESEAIARMNENFTL